MRAAGRYVGPAAVEDVAQEALTRAWQSRAACRHPDRPWPWLGQILHNEAVRHLGKVVDTCDDSAMERIGCADGTDEVLGRMALHTMLDMLPAPDRAVLRLHYELDMSVASMAKVLDAPEGAVKVRLHRARQKLRPVVLTSEVACQPER